MTYLLFGLLQPQADRELREPLIYARNNASNRRRALNAARTRMRDIDPDNHRLLLLQPPHVARVQPMVLPAQLHIDFQRDIGEVLVLSLLFERLLCQDALAVQTEHDGADPLDGRVDVVVAALEKHEDNVYLAERTYLVLEGPCCLKSAWIVGRRRELDGLDDRRSRDEHAAPLTFVRETFDPVIEALVAGPCELRSSIDDDEHTPLVDPRALVKLDVEDVPRALQMSISHTTIGLIWRETHRSTL